MGKPFNSKLSLAIDRAIIGMETTRGIVRWLWRIRFNWLTRDIP